MTKKEEIKAIIQKIDIGKIANYSQEYPKSKTLREIIRYSKRIWDSEKDEEIFKLAVSLAYDLDIIVNKGKYVKDEKEKEYWLEISEELFENTLGEKR